MHALARNLQLVQGMAADFRVSVVVPCYNGEAYLERTLQSALDQTLPPREVIVVDDGSTDGSATVAQRFGSLVKVIRQENAGESRARNVGIEASSGDWVALLDADDVWEPTKLERQAEACTSRPDVVCCHTWFHNLHGEELKAEPLPLHMQPPVYDLTNVLLNFLVLPSSAVIRRATHVRFPEWTKAGEDALYFAELSRQGAFVFLNEPLTLYRKHARSQTASSTNIVRAREGVLQWLDETTVGSRHERLLARQALFVDLAMRAQVAIWRRDWTLYWAIRSLVKHHERPEDPALVTLQQRVWPKWVYTLADTVRPA